MAEFGRARVRGRNVSVQRRQEIATRSLAVFRLGYRRDAPPALNDVSFSIADGEHVAIVGRTGAGKTSLTNALFRLHPLESGVVRVAGVDAARISLARLRRSMALVPQESGLFRGSLRFNLNPAGEFDDDRLWSALERVDLKQFVSRCA